MFVTLTVLALAVPPGVTPAIVLEPLPGTSLGQLQTRFEADCPSATEAR